MNLDSLPELLSIEKAGEVLGLSRSAAYRAAREGYLPTVRISKERVRVPKRQLIELLEADST